MKKIYILGAVVCGLAACKPNIEPKAPERGDADFTSYLAAGSEHTAGIMDGSYYLGGQINSFPLMLSQQFQSIGGGDFKQPLVPGEHGWPIGKRVLDYIKGPCDTVVTVGSVAFKGALDTVGTGSNIYAAKGPFNNMGIPGCKVTDYLIPGYGTVNPYAARMFKTVATSRPLNELLLREHTFFTAWVGMNDVLDYATAGGETPSTPGNRKLLTTPVAFSTAYDSVINTLARNGAKGVVMTIPDVLQMPFFRTIPPKGLALDIKDANRLNLKYNSTQLHFDVGMNYFVIQDTTTSLGYRQIKDGEIVLLNLPMDSVKCKGWGWDSPIPANYILTAAEIAKINNAVSVFNDIIYTVAERYNIPVSDVRYYLQTVKENGAQYNAANYSIKFASGGIYSLDGIHFTGRGNALVANSIINTINGHYGSSIPFVDVNKFAGVRVP